MKLLLAPHSDDETLWATFTILREQPRVVIVTDSSDAPMAMRRRAETQAAMAILGATVEFLGYSEDGPFHSLAGDLSLVYGEPEMVYAPEIEERGNLHHNFIGHVARQVFPRVTYYMTYTERGKSTGNPVPFEPGWPLLKLKALACYESQINRSSCQPHFLREQMEYYAP